MSMISNGQAVAVGVVALIVVWYAKKKVSSAATTIKEVIYGPELGPPVKLVKTAKQRADDYVRMGYAVIDSKGVFKITPLGEMYIKQGGDI